MKNLIFICCILIILFKTGNVLSDNNIFNVNNIEISKETYKNKDRLVSKAFQKAFDELINRLLLEEDHKRLSGINLEQIKGLISYYQIIDQDEETKDKNNIKFNVFFDIFVCYFGYVIYKFISCGNIYTTFFITILYFFHL